MATTTRPRDAGTPAGNEGSTPSRLDRDHPRRRAGRKGLAALVGSGDRIGLFTLPFLIVGVALDVADPSLFSVGGPSFALRMISIAVLVAGLTVWAWSVVLILVKVPRGELITTGPYAVVRHPLYISVALFVLPWIGFLGNTWVGAPIGVVMYVATRVFAPREEAVLSARFGRAWDAYRQAVTVPWL